VSISSRISQASRFRRGSHLTHRKSRSAVLLTLALSLIGGSVCRADGADVRVAEGATNTPGQGVVADSSGGSDNTASLQATQVIADNAATDGGRNDLQEVVISAATHMEAVRDLPTSISVVTGDELTRLGAVDITDVLKRLSDVSFDYGNPRTGYLTMRGITVASSDTIDPSIGMRVDGVSYAYTPLITGANFFDLDDLTVTRGPQGTEGGKNSSIGEIQVTSRAPTFTSEATASLTLGNFNTVRAEATAGGAVIDDLLAFRISAFRDEENGQYWNHYSQLAGRSSYDNTDETEGRAQLLFTPSSDFNARFIVDIQPNGSAYINGLTVKEPTPNFYANGAPVNQALQPLGILSRSWFTQEANYTPADYLAYPVDDDNNGAIITGTNAYTSLLTWRFAGQTLESITGYKSAYFSAANDEGTPFNVTSDGGYIVYYHQFSQELRLSSDTGRIADYVTGLYFLKTHDNSFSRTEYGSDAGAWYANVAQYNTLDANGDGQQLMSNALNRLYKGTEEYAQNSSLAAFAHVNWHLSDPLTLATGVRLTYEDRQLDQSITAPDYGFGAQLNPVAITNQQLGGFASSATTGALLATNSPAQIALANALAGQYFGAPSYAALTPAQLSQVAAAKAVRLTQLGTLYGTAVAQPYKGTLPTAVASLSYKFTPELSSYLTWQHGAKAGVAQINGATPTGGISVPVQPERSNSYEIGTKAALLARTLIVNADVFLDNIDDFQQSVYYFDPVATALLHNGTLQYTSGGGNVPRAQTKGIELDADYSGIKYTELRVAGAYTDAVYKDFPNLAQPAEDANLTTKFRDVTGDTLPFASKLTFNVSADVRYPVFGSKVFHGSVNYHFVGGYNSDTSLSAYAWVPSYSLVDLSLGLARADQRFEVNLQAKNLLNTNYDPLRTWNSFTPGFPRWYGVTFSSRFL